MPCLKPVTTKALVQYQDKGQSVTDPLGKHSIASRTKPRHTGQGPKQTEFYAIDVCVCVCATVGQLQVMQRLSASNILYNHAAKSLIHYNCTL